MSSNQVICHELGPSCETDRTHGLHVVLVLLALDDNLLQSVDELLSSLLWESIGNNVFGSIKGVRSGSSVLLGNLLLELVGLFSSLALGLVSVNIWSVAVGLVGLLAGSAGDLVSLLSKRGVGVSRSVQVLSVCRGLVLGLVLELVFLLHGLLLCLLSLVVGLTRRSSVALCVGDPVHQ